MYSKIACKRIRPCLVLFLTAGFILSGCAGRQIKETPSAEEVSEPSQAPPSVKAEAAIITANQLASEDRFGEAALVLEEILSSEPENAEALRLLARIYASMGEKGKSSATWQKLYAVDPGDPDAAYENGLELARSGNWHELKASVLAVEQAGAADERHYLLLGRAEYESGNRQKAEEYLTKAGSFAQANTMLGEIYFDSGRTSRAKASFEKAVRKDPGSYSAHIHLGYIEYSRNRFSSALSHYEKALKIAPANAHAHLSIAALYKKMKKPSSAITHFKKGLELEGAPPDERKNAYDTLCRLLFEEKRTDEVYRVVRRGIDEFPGSGGLYFYWGMALLKDGLSSRAKAKFKEAATDPVWRKAALQRFHSIR